MTLRDRLRAIAARLCSARTMERLIDPALTDVEIEYRNAIAQGRAWRGRWIRLTGCFAFLKVIACLGYRRIVDWSADDGQALARTLGLSASAFLLAAFLLISPAARGVPASQLPYLIPQALPLAIPVGIALGIFCGLGGRTVSSRLKGAALALALACSAASLATMVWILPAANQAFRVSVAEHLSGRQVTLTTGPSEMPIGELRRRIDALAQSGRTRAARTTAFDYYIRWALPCAPFVLALFALSVMPRRPVRHWILAAAACGACLSYYLFLLAADFAARRTLLPVVAFVWLPNLVFAVVSAGLMVADKGGDAEEGASADA
jgi:lipopolysaccharide export system permease LptF/LptG-like protein